VVITTIQRTRLLAAGVLCMTAVLATGCGGGGGGGQPPVTTYAVTATAGTGGTISPTSATVNAGTTTAFTVTPNSGYTISGVTGCGGTLTGNTYTTGATSANCTVSASFVAQYNVTASTAGPGGAISPSSAAVIAGATTTFTVTPNSGYTINSVTGCGGSLSGNTYTIASANASCAVTASFSAAFTWVTGSSTPDVMGVYGTQGVADAGNAPGARHGPITWTDASGNLWTYGGYGVGDPIFSDMWKYSPKTGLWTWVAGSNTPNNAAVYGTLGVAAAANNPGSNAASAYSWTDSNGNLWVFGGYGYDSTGTRGWLNALWEYSPTTGMWTWQAGSTTVNARGVYGTQGVAAATNYPGARAGGGFTDADGNAWLYGGAGYDSNGTLGGLSDLWRYSAASHQWTWINGSNIVNQKGVYGTQGVASATNSPGAGPGPSWMDANGNFWLFAGTGYDTNGNLGQLNALWKYSPSTNQWTWVSGSNTVNAKGVYGTQGVASDTNVPGARHYTTTWTDSAGNFWLFGGTGFDSTGAYNELNDLWKYSPSTNQWTWVAGSNTVNAPANYGTRGVAAAANVPGARDDFSTWNDGTFVWLFGGEGLNASGADPNAPAWNDLWKYPVK